MASIMTKEPAQKNIRDALSAIVATEKSALRAIYTQDDEDQRIYSENLRLRIEKLRPMMELLNLMKEEVRDEAVQIVIDPVGDKATVKIGNYHTLAISTNWGPILGITDLGLPSKYLVAANSHFTIDEDDFNSSSNEYSEKQHQFDTVNDAVLLILNVIAKKIAASQVNEERRKK